MDPAIADLNAKVDHLTTQVAYLTEVARRQERLRQDRSELLADLTPIANDVFRLTAEQLEEVQQYVDLGDVLRLAKRLARNGRNFEALLVQLESIVDLLATLTPLTDEAFSRAVEALDEADRKGYFTFAKGGLRIADQVVTHFTAEDVNKLGDNVVLILNTVKDMTQPEILSFVRNTVQDVEEGAEAPVDVSYRALLRQMRDPNVRRGMAMTMRVLSTVGNQATLGTAPPGRDLAREMVSAPHSRHSDRGDDSP